MFTGIVETTGLLRSIERRGPGARLVIATSRAPDPAGPVSRAPHAAGPPAFEGLVVGESIAVHGVCLTVQAVMPGGFEADATGETLDKTTLGSLRAGERVHLERALKVGGRFGGHIVSGHVDGRLVLRSRDELGDARRLVFGVEDRSLCRFIAPKGSVAIDGVSLTVNHAEGDRFDVVIIPHTLAVTTLGELSVGDPANLEVDMLARYVARLLGDADSAGRDEILLAKLKAAGFA